MIGKIDEVLERSIKTGEEAEAKAADHLRSAVWAFGYHRSECTICGHVNIEFGCPDGVMLYFRSEEARLKLEHIRLRNKRWRHQRHLRSLIASPDDVDIADLKQQIKEHFQKGHSIIIVREGDL